MNASRFLIHAFGRSLHHPALILACYAATLIPATIVAFGASLNLTSALDRSLYAERALDGQALEVGIELLVRGSGAMVSLAGTTAAMMALMLPIQLLLASIITHRLLAAVASVEPIPAGLLARSWGRFLRLAIWFGLALALALVLAATLSSLVSEAAIEHRDGRLDIVGWLLAGLWLLLVVPLLDLAHDMARLASVRHDQGSTLRGYLRATWLVIRHPLLLGPLAAASILTPSLLYLVYYLIRDPWTVSTAAGLIVLVALQQTVMLLRAGARVWMWAASVEAYRHLGEPRLCSGRTSEPASSHPALDVAPPRVVISTEAKT